MNNELFNELVASLREGGAILREEEDASRTFVRLSSTWCGRSLSLTFRT